MHHLDAAVPEPVLHPIEGVRRGRSGPRVGGTRAGRVSRWGFLLTAVALITALVGTGLSVYFAVQSNSVPLVRLQSRELLATTRHALHQSDVHTPEFVERQRAKLAKEGVRVIQVIDRGEVLVSAGAPAPVKWVPADPEPDSRLELGPGIRARVHGPFIGPGRGAGWRARTGASMEEPLPWQHLANATIVVEFEPQEVQHLASHAFATLVMSACAAVVLLLATVGFWRLSVRAERADVRSARDQQLKTLGKMSAVLGHELRNPLAGLKGHAQLILRKPTDEQGVRRAAETVVREAVRLEQLANQILEFARTGEVVPAPADPMLVAQAAVEAVASPRVRLIAQDTLPTWPLDRARMEQVLVNLLRNALQASGDDAEVELEVARVDRTLIFEVRDRGEGLVPGTEEDLFEPFVTHRAKGSGLGLTLAREIVQGHHGRIEAMNRRGGGAAFRVSVPRGG